MKALITSGGRGTRLRPITHTQNKHLIPIANKPILHYALEYVSEAGIKEVGIITNADTTDVQDAIGDGSKWGVDITYIPQSAPLGLGHVIKISEDFIGDDDFIFYLGDNIVVGGIERFINEFERAKSNCHLVLAKVKDPERFGVPEIEDKRIVRVEEKPDKPKSNYAVSGIYLYDKHIFEAVNNIEPSDRGELEISDAHQYLIENGYEVSFSEITGWWKDTGKPLDLLEANRLVLDNLESKYVDQSIDQDSTVLGRAEIAKSARIINSNIRGPAIIGKDCVIENSYIGPYTSIFDNTIILNSEVEYSIILDNCKIDDVDFRIESSLLGKDVEIVKASPKPKTHRFIIGNQSRIEII
ncbi:MAG: Glucose-1-phosphate thymidylyltransferase [Candidatus Marinimicrobia bacterium]|nr:Glucose-1-phosphate thymidylyltransferase [Candidatus Neomarinimicrobiota bacterium]